MRSRYFFKTLTLKITPLTVNRTWSHTQLQGKLRMRSSSVLWQEKWVLMYSLKPLPFPKLEWTRGGRVSKPDIEQGKGKGQLDETAGKTKQEVIKVHYWDNWGNMNLVCLMVLY